MEFFINYWWLIVIAIAALGVLAYFIVGFINYPTNKKLSKVREWLLYACAEAEKELGSGTGQLKLRYVYNLFLSKFPYFAKVIPFESFSNLVDEALEKFRAMLEKNTKVQEYITGGKAAE